MDIPLYPTTWVERNGSRLSSRRKLRRNRKILLTIWWLFLALWGAGLVITVIVPRVILRSSTLVVLSGSMRPALQPGDLIVIRPISIDTACHSIAVGEVITYLPFPDNPTSVTHRVTEIRPTNTNNQGCEFIVQGDANSTPDAPINPQQIRARVTHRIPVSAVTSRLPRPIQTQPIRFFAFVGIAIVGVHTLLNQALLKSRVGKKVYNYVIN